MDNERRSARTLRTHARALAGLKRSESCKRSSAPSALRSFLRPLAAAAFTARLNASDFDTPHRRAMCSSFRIVFASSV